VRTTEVYASELAGDWETAARTWSRLGCPYDATVARLAGDSRSHVLSSIRGCATVPASGDRVHCPGRVEATFVHPAISSCSIFEIIATSVRSFVVESS
jgi:hypothetical protein